MIRPSNVAFEFFLPNLTIHITDSEFEAPFTFADVTATESSVSSPYMEKICIQNWNGEPMDVTINEDVVTIPADRAHTVDVSIGESVTINGYTFTRS